MTSKLKAERERQLAGVAELKRKIEETETQAEKKLAHLRACLVGAEAALAACVEVVAAEDAAEKVEQFYAVAAELDADGENPERLARFEKLSAELHFAKRVALAHEARQMNVGRMRRLPGVIFKPAYPTWAALAQAWVRDPARGKSAA